MFLIILLLCFCKIGRNNIQYSPGSNICLLLDMLTGIEIGYKGKKLLPGG